MIFTTASMSNRWGTTSTTGVGVSNHRIKNRRASHKTYNTLCELNNFNLIRDPISQSFNINNSDSWYVSYTDPLGNITINLNNGSWDPAPNTHTLQNIVGGTVYDIFFTWLSPTTVKQTITSINDSNNTITWTTLDSATGLPYPDRATIIWTLRLC